MSATPYAGACRLLAGRSWVVGRCCVQLASWLLRRYCARCTQHLGVSPCAPTAWGLREIRHHHPRPSPGIRHQPLLRAAHTTTAETTGRGKYCETPDAPSPPCSLRTSRPPVLRWSVALIQRAAMRTLQGRVRMAPRWRSLAFCREILALRAPNSRQNAPPTCRLVLVLWSRQARTASGNSGAWLHGSAYGLRFTSALAPTL